MRRCLLPLVFLLVVHGCFASALSGGIVYGSDWAYTVTAPAGWVMDDEAWSQQGIYALFYDSKTAGGTPPALIYVNSVPAQGSAPTAYDTFVDNDIATVSSSGDARIVERAPYMTVMKVKARVVSFSYPGKSQYEEVVYLMYTTTIHMVVLVSKNSEELARVESKLFEVVDSIGFMDKAAGGQTGS